MSNSRLALAVAAVALIAVPVLVPSPALADTFWKVGTKVSYDFDWQSDWPLTQSIGGSTKCWDQGVEDAWAQVKKSEDKVYVHDICKDGRSAIAQIITYDEEGNDVRKRNCRNSHGVGTWAVCDWNWPEDKPCMAQMPPWELNCYNMVLVVGSWDYDGGSSPYWDHGNSLYFKD